MRLTAAEAGPEDGIRFTTLDRRDKCGIFCGAIFQVRVLHENDFATGDLETGTQSRAFSAISFVSNNLIDRMGQLTFEERAGVIGRAIVHDYNLNVLDRSRPDRAHHLGESVTLIVAGNDDGKSHPLGYRLKKNSGGTISSGSPGGVQNKRRRPAETRFS